MSPAGGGGRPYPVDPLPPGAADGLTALWVAVVRAGGAVGFLPGDPADQVRAAAAAVIADVAAGRERMLAIGPADAPAGVVFLRPGNQKTSAHRADVLRLMVHPDHQRRGLGRALMDAAVAHATELGLEQLLLSARGGTGLPEYYARLGWTPVGVWPDAVKLTDDDRRAEHWFQRRLR